MYDIDKDFLMRYPTPVRVGPARQKPANPVRSERKQQ